MHFTSHSLVFDNHVFLFCRILSLCNLRLGQTELALKLAREAVSADSSKKSLFCLFNAQLEGLTSEEQTINSFKNIIKDLKARDDFEVADLIALGKAAYDAGPTKKSAVLEILDQLCTLVAQRPGDIGDVPAGILLQHTAQLSFKCCSEGGGNINCSSGLDHFAKSLKKYAEILLKASKTASKVELGPPSVVEWFYAMRYEVLTTRSSNIVTNFAVASILRRAQKASSSSFLRLRSRGCRKSFTGTKIL